MPMYDGDCTIRLDTVTDRLEVTNADQHIKISPELVDQWRAGESHHDLSIADDLVTIVASNRTVAYRLAELQTDGFGTQWYTADLVE